MDKQSIRKELPEKGIPFDRIRAAMEDMREGDVRWKEGRTWSMIYYLNEAHNQLLKEAYSLFLTENYLNPFAFGSLQRMEKEVLQMAAGLFHGDEAVTGTMTSGGTESILLAVYTYRERAAKLFPNIKQPEFILPVTGHPAFEKAAHLFNIRIRKAPVDQYLQADPEAISRLINKNTIFLVASAPSYPHGVLDPVIEIATLAEKHQLPLHVDACIGGYMLPWVEKLGYPIEAWDFRVPGVTSISADVHKFGYAAKGASTLLYRSMDFLKYQFYVATEWPGGIYASTTLLGSRTGGSIAAAWTALQSLGQEGYLTIARQLMEAAHHLWTALEALPEIQVLGRPCMNIVAFSTVNNQPDIFVVADQLETAGWMVDRQQLPNCIHLTVLPQNMDQVDTYLKDLRTSLDFALEHPAETAKGNAALYGLMARIPFRGMVARNVRKIFEQAYSLTPQKQLSAHEGDSNSGAATSETHGPTWMGKANQLLTQLDYLKRKLFGR